MKNADGGWLITTGALSKDAKGTQEEWEREDNTRRQMLSFYTAERIIELLLDTKLIRKCIPSNRQQDYFGDRLHQKKWLKFGR